MAFQGLDSAEARARLARHGPNALPAPAGPAWWQRLLQQFASPIIYILLFALAFDLLTRLLDGARGWPFESLAIGLILLLNAAMGMWQEYRAEDSLARLRELSAPRCCVWRDGRLVEIPAEEVVPGDLLRLDAGERVPADGRVLEQHGLILDESILTGESLPQARHDGAEVFAGTLVVRGRARIEVTRTGPASAMGRIAGMLGSLRGEVTPLERRLQRFGHRVARWIALAAVVLTVAGTAIEGPGSLPDMVLFAVAVAVAAVPEGLPAVVTLTLALGTERMARRAAVVRRLAAVEALGSVTVIATDKTGTLTENALTVRSLESPDEAAALRAMVLASEAEADGSAGDPMELALYAFATARGVDPGALQFQYPAHSERPFDSAWRFSRVTVLEDSRLVSYLKGAPEVLLPRATLDDAKRRHWEERLAQATASGLRVIALARAEGEREDDLEWLGLVELWDPPRPEVPDAIRACRAAGIRVLMVTGDHPATAQAVARSIGLPDEPVFSGDALEQMDSAEFADAAAKAAILARAAPEHKLRLVECLQAAGEIVAVTGDGVNDAPALKRADIGIAMGQRGSAVAREVADLVLLDDNFATIAAAVEEGRGIYANILKFIRFLFSTNVALLLLIGVGFAGAAISGLTTDTGQLLLPLLAAQLLWINVIADGPPALALGFDRNPGLMRQRPRPASAALLGREDLRFILVTGGLKAAAGLVLFFGLPALGYAAAVTQTAVFLYESLAQLGFAYPSRHLGHESPRNRALNLIIAATVVLQLLTVLLPGLRDLLGLVLPPTEVLLTVLLALLLTVTGAELWSRRHPAER
ncbi:MAG: HAD family hydrolase [Gammaproteobacteria bacterium]|nr:MAG: HAD family hydrolase [Gammaproteobacteria bacterium]